MCTPYPPALPDVDVQLVKLSLVELSKLLLDVPENSQSMQPPSPADVL